MKFLTPGSGGAKSLGKTIGSSKIILVTSVHCEKNAIYGYKVAEIVKFMTLALISSASGSNNILKVLYINFLECSYTLAH